MATAAERGRRPPETAGSLGPSVRRQGVELTASHYQRLTSAILLLPDRVHSIWTLPPDDDDFPERWRQIKGRFTPEYPAAGGRDWEAADQHRHQGHPGLWLGCY